MKRNIVLSIFLIAITFSLAFFIKCSETGINKEYYSYKKIKSEQFAKKDSKQGKRRNRAFGTKNLNRGNYRYQNIIITKTATPLKRGERKNSSSNSLLKYFLWATWLLLILVVIMSRKKIKRFRMPILLLTVILFGILLGANPNPMQSIVKLFKVFNGMEREPVVIIFSFIFFSIFSILGSKLICSWGCPLGALQEVIFNIPIYKEKFRYQLPFIISFSVRLILFILFFLLLFGIGLGVSNYVFYRDVNYFNIFDFHKLTLFASLTLPIFILSSLYLYRPFCQLICPYGLYAWLLENFAVNKIIIIEDKCTKCLKCIKSCPTQAMNAIYEKKREYFLPDCWACGECIEVCPTDAVKYDNYKKINN
jgi:NAD-dependent dihydropyrimidine dehydrogenase PreA subunit